MDCWVLLGKIEILIQKIKLNETRFIIWLNLMMVIDLLSHYRLIIMYYILPETEKRSLEDIELHYSDDSKKITDIHIRIRGQIG